MEESGQLHFVNRKEGSFLEKSELGFGIHFVDGHTDKQMLPHLKYKGKTLVFVADLIATVGHIPLPYVMGYDTRPLLTLKEKQSFLNKAVENDWLLLFEHDAHNQICSLKQTEKGVRLNELFTYNELFKSQ